MENHISETLISIYEEQHIVHEIKEAKKNRTYLQEKIIIFIIDDE